MEAWFWSAYGFKWTKPLQFNQIYTLEWQQWLSYNDKHHLKWNIPDLRADVWMEGGPQRGKTYGEYLACPRCSGFFFCYYDLFTLFISCNRLKNRISVFRLKPYKLQFNSIEHQFGSSLCVIKWPKSREQKFSSTDRVSLSLKSVRQLFASPFLRLLYLLRPGFVYSLSSAAPLRISINCHPLWDKSSIERHCVLHLKSY